MTGLSALVEINEGKLIVWLIDHKQIDGAVTDAKAGVYQQKLAYLPCFYDQKTP